MTKYSAIIILMLLFAACNNSGDENKNEMEPEEQEELNENTDAEKMRTVFSETYRLFTLQDSTFNASKFEYAGDDSVATPALSETKQLKEYYPYFIYNRDSTYAIDLYSYNILLVKRNGKTIAQEGGPDTEVGLVDLKNKTRQRIYFGGSSSMVLDANWTSNTELFLLAGEIIGQNKFQPAIIKFNTENKISSHFIYPDTLNIKPGEYKNKEFRNL